MNKLVKQLIKYELFGDMEQLELFIKQSGSSILAEELAEIVMSGNIDLFGEDLGDGYNG